MNEPRSERRSILYFSHVDWFWVKQRPQQLAEQLAKTYRVTYASLAPFLTRTNPLLCGHVPGEDPRKAARTRTPDLEVLRLRSPVPRRLWPLLWRSMLRARLSRLVAQTNCVWLTHPSLYPFVQGTLKGKPLVYDCMDDHEAFHLPSRRKAELTALEQSVARSAQVVFVSSARLREKVVRYASCSPCVLHNGYDELVFGPGNPREPPDDEFARILREHRKMAGYVGSISEWFDWESVCYCADRLRETVDFVLIGPAYEGEVPKVPNIHLLGPRPHQSLPGYLRHFDVALLPFKVNRLTESVNPVKLYEYLSMGKNTVACRYKELVDLGFDVAYYGSKEDMLAAMQAGLATPPSPEVIASRRRSVAAETWSNRGQVVIQHVADLLR